jgi:hypothetical protein
VATAFTAPSQQEFQDCFRLMEEQAGHLAALERWVGDQCLDTEGLTGVLTPLTQLIPKVAQPFTQKLAQAHQGVHDVSGMVKLTGDHYAQADQVSLDAIVGIYPAPLPHFPDLRALHLPQVGDFTDEPVTLSPPKSAADDTVENTKHDLAAMKVMLDRGPLALAEKAFRLFTGQDLMALLIHPLTGDYGRLKYLHDAYAEMAAGAYTVAATIRKGAWGLADDWTGDAAIGFDSYLFRWGMGIGGIGDGAALMAKAYGGCFAAVMPLVESALTAINMLIKKELRELAELVAGDAAAALFGGPLNPIADLVALANTCFRIYETIRLIIEGIHSIKNIYTRISKVITETHDAVDKILHFASQPLQSLRELIDHLEERGFSFETYKIWNPALGVARMTMLPAVAGDPGDPASPESAGSDSAGSGPAGSAAPASSVQPASEPEKAGPDDFPQSEDQVNAVAEALEAHQTPRQQEFARRIHDHLTAGGELEGVRHLIHEMTQTMAEQVHAGSASRLAGVRARVDLVEALHRGVRRDDDACRVHEHGHPG